MAFLLYDMLEKEMEQEGSPESNRPEGSGAAGVPTPGQRTFLPRLDPLEEYTDHEFLRRYRLPKEAVIELGQKMVDQNILGGLNGMGWALTPVLTMCLGLRFLATGSMYRDIANDHHVARSSVCRSVARTLRLLISLADEHIQFPYTKQQKKENALEFARKTGFPCIVGVLEGTHIGLKTPANEEGRFRNPNGDCTINTQVICDASGRFIDVDPTWPGSTPDHKVWKSSIIGQALEKYKFLQGYYILGHDGYPTLPWLLTSFPFPVTEAELNYNTAHAQTRTLGKDCIKQWKLRFRCLDKTGGQLQCSPLTCNKIILSTAVLHNLAMWYKVDMENVDTQEEPLTHIQPPVQVYQGGEEDEALRIQGEEERKFLAQNRFTQQ